MIVRLRSVALIASAVLPLGTSAQDGFVDHFDTLNPAWVVNRYEPAAFAVVSFLGDNRLQITISEAQSQANRPFPFNSSAFWDVQGRERPGNITTTWSLSAEVFVASTYNTTTGAIVRTDLWGETGFTPGAGDFMILGFTNESLTPAQIYNPAAPDRAFRFQAYDNGISGWVDLGVPGNFTFDAWHTLSATSTATSFNYSIDGAPVLTLPAGSGGNLLSAMLQSYNYGEAGNYSVYWDNLAAVPIPEPDAGTLALIAGATSLLIYRRKQSAAPHR